MRTPWSRDAIDDFRNWHEARMRDLGYDAGIVRELRRAREKFLAKIPVL